MINIRSERKDMSLALTYIRRLTRKCHEQNKNKIKKKKKESVMSNFMSMDCILLMKWTSEMTILYKLLQYSQIIGTKSCNIKKHSSLYL